VLAKQSHYRAGWCFLQSDLTAYFAQLGLAVPQVLTVSIDGGTTALGVTLMLRSPGHRSDRGSSAGATLWSTSLPNSDRGFLDAVTTRFTTLCIGHRCSPHQLGKCRFNLDRQRCRSWTRHFGCCRIGVTVCCASGDAGSSDGTAMAVPMPIFRPRALLL